MLYVTPPATPRQEGNLRELDERRRVLAFHVRRAHRWIGALRRLAQAEATSASTTIEGFSATPEQALQVLEGRTPEHLSKDDIEAVRGYHMAMDRVLGWADYPHFRWTEELLSELHFMVVYAHRSSHPGLYRDRSVWVTGRDGSVEYEGAPTEDVPGLMQELATWLRDGDLDRPAIVRAAMAHLHLVSIHPFADGNGRTARILQSLVLAREGILVPELASIEEYLAENTQRYYSALRSRGDHWDPTRDASPWIDFCLEAHLEQAKRLDRRIRIMYARNSFADALVASRSYPERYTGILDQVLARVPVRNDEYRRQEQISAAAATLDLRRLVADGWLLQRGAGRSTHYVAAPALLEAWQREHQEKGLPELVRPTS